jgi:hypothetical protein
MLQPPPAEPQMASVSDIHADLVALSDEFEEFSFDRRGRTISVTTEPIQLEDVYLGAFEIRLDYSDLPMADAPSYRVIALDPHPAASDESVIHPHVQGEFICEGDARLPICRALEQGRLLDFFVILGNVLRTYNEGSPYVRLADWHGVVCTDCGSLVGDDQRWTCQKCETTLCGECFWNCPGCDEVFCGACVTCCEGCNENHCFPCIGCCRCCDTEFCRECLNDDQTCRQCLEKKAEEVKEERARCKAPAGLEHTDAAVQSDSVGKAAVFA